MEGCQNAMPRVHGPAPWCPTSGARRTVKVVAWWQIVVAIALAIVIWKVGTGMLRAISTGQPPTERRDAEDVEELDVHLVCDECGTEYQVTRLGQLQVPRHCGEPMRVVRRPTPGAS
jgi:hypothetical protein